MRLIDADALIDTYNGNILTAQTDYAEGCRDIMEDIQNAPTIDAEPVVHGRWVREDDWMHPKCSACELPPKTPGYIGDDDFYAENYKRCPNCGAVMGGGDAL